MYRTVFGPQNGRINLDGKEVINLASNNYLGLANHVEIVKAAKKAIETFGVGAGAGRTIVGNYSVHNELERILADFKGVEATCVFNSGLAANYGTIPVLVGKDDEVFSDELNHASIIDGIRLSKAKINVYKHLDMNDLERHLKGSENKNKLIITDGVFSMDGDLAPLPRIVELSKKYNAKVMVDDAHGDGVMGKSGRGTVEHFGIRNDIYVETGSISKAFGSAGGFVAGSKELIERIQREARSFIFTATPMQPVMAAAAIKAIELLTESDMLVSKLWVNREYFVSKMRMLGFDLGTTKTPIVPVMVGEEEKAQILSDTLFENGVFVQAIKYPIVGKGKARLRVILSAAHEKEDLDKAISVFEKVGKSLAIIK